MSCTIFKLWYRKSPGHCLFRSLIRLFLEVGIMNVILLLCLPLISFFLINLFILLICFWVHWVFAATRGLSPVVPSGGPLWRRGARASHCGGLSCCGARALGTRAPERRLSSCGARAQLLRSMWDPPGPGLEPVSPPLAGGFLTTVPPGKP